MPGLEIKAAWERLDDGSAEEQACFGIVTIRAGRTLLTEGIDGFVDGRRDGPLVSNYHLAEWLAWNWWRLTSEPTWAQETPEWAFSHRLSTIGEGYVWPNITIWSDLERTSLLAKPSKKTEFSSFKCTTDRAVFMPTADFEHAVDQYVGQVLGRLSAKDLSRTNLDHVWWDLIAERTDPNLAKRRKLEALLGQDPDEASPDVVDRLVADAVKLGEAAINELAADHSTGHLPLSADSIEAEASSAGVDANPADVIDLASVESLPNARDVPAWRRGYAAARALREQIGNIDGPMTDGSLAEVSGVGSDVLKERRLGVGRSFALDQTSKTGRVVLRSEWRTGRRFDLARLLGDRLATASGEYLLPATQARTYRQQLQRAFAAELLCPLGALVDQLAGDFSDDALGGAAHYFQVSPLAVQNQLVSNRYLSREGIEDELESVVAA